MKKIIVIISIVIALAVLILSLYFAVRPKRVYVQGVADATDVKISSRVAGRVNGVFVKEGDTVKAGDLLITLDAPDLKAKAVQADGARISAEAQQDKAETGTRQEEIDAAFNQWQKALVAERLAKQTYDRIQQLYREGVVSTQQRDEAKAQYDAARQDTLAAEAKYTMARNGAREEDKEAASGAALQASGAQMEVQSYLDDTFLSSPIDGEVSTVVLSVGELAAGGFPLITVTDLTDVYFVFNIREDLMSHFTVGDTFDVCIPAVGKGLHKVKVYYVAPRGDFATWSSTKTTGEFDLRTFEVKARPVNAVPNLRPGMSAVYELD